ncbi:MAG TPA: N-acetylneuraminate synthase [Vicingaceae bacterium]
MQKTIIIAEAGVNHNGDIIKAKELIDVAAAAGADYVKFQTFVTELNVSKIAPRATYQEKNTGNTESQFDMIKKLELSFDDFKALNDYANKCNIKFLSTGFDFPSIDFLDELGIDFFKIPSGEITNLPYLEHIAKKGKKVIISTGMATIEEIKSALHVLTNNGLNKNDITVLHCNTEYPTPMQDVNLKAMLHIQKEFDVAIGYSDHTLGIEVPIAAVALGATVIEKHFTLDNNLSGPDHKASLEPNELKNMVVAIRNIELAISGDGIKKTSKSEQSNKAVARKSIHIKKALPQGHIIESSDLIVKRPGDGISPMEINKVIGKMLTTALKEETKLLWNHLN